MATTITPEQLSILSENLCLFYSRLVDEIHQRLMHKALDAGHQGLKLSHALILPQISGEGSRIIDIAKSQGVSKQAIGQIANELEELGYIERIPDQHDKRSKKLVLTQQGIKLIQQAASFMNDVDSELEEQVGTNTFKTIKTQSLKLFKAMTLKFPDAGQFVPEIDTELPLIAYTTPIATQLDIKLQEENAKKGHSPLKRSYWQILEKVTRPGVRINELAELHGISKQAISQLANEIEREGYIIRENDPADKRAKRLLLTDKGKDLINTTLASTNAVESQVIDYIGLSAFKELKQSLKDFFVIEEQETKTTNESAESVLKHSLQSALLNLAEKDRETLLQETEQGKMRLSKKGLSLLESLRF